MAIHEVPSKSVGEECPRTVNKEKALSEHNAGIIYITDLLARDKRLLDEVLKSKKPNSS